LKLKLLHVAAATTARAKGKDEDKDREEDGGKNDEGDDARGHKRRKVNKYCS